MSQDNPQHETNQSKNLPIFQNIKHPTFSVRTEEEAYEITMSLSNKLTYAFENFSAHYNSSDKTVVYEATKTQQNTYRLLLPLAELLAPVSESAMNETIRFYFTLSWKVDEERFEQDFPLALSLFDQFDAFGLSQTIYRKQVFIPYFTETDEVFSIALNIPVPSSQYFAHHELDIIKLAKTEFAVTGKLALKAFTLNQVGVVLVGKRSGKEYPFSTNHTLEKQEKSTHLNHYQYSFSLNMQTFVRKLLIEKFDDEDFDLYLELYLNGLYSPVSIPLTTQGVTLPKNIYKDLAISYGRTTFIWALKLQGSQQALSFAFTKYKKDIYAYYKEIAPLSLVKSPINQKKNIWVIGEKPMQAKNNGWAFFCYLRENHPDQAVYYVLDIHSPDYEKAYAYDAEHLIEFKSKAYIDTLLAAQVLLFTDSPYDLYPSRSPLQLDFIRAKKVLLQKNVLGLEDVSETLGYSTKNFRTDLVLASSKIEERYLQQTLGYPENSIRLTGLARFDALLSKSSSLEIASNVVICPQEFPIGKYGQKELIGETAAALLTLVQQSEFMDFVDRHYLTPVIALPDAMKDFTGKFQQLNCEVVLQSQMDTLDLLKSSRIFITDQHPLAFDASFIGIPVLFYQPELPFKKNTESAFLRQAYLNELPGEIATSQNSLLYLMQQLAEQDFKQSRKNRQKADALLYYPDTHSSERIFKAVTELLQ
ncbi:CDP-glycerol glycerophosphotransferase family protein [Desemzia sp. FAM 24101]|uniref:CDP-glycerol glycerophosphotransferase family protein n=1 Tax=unclassified Desemzia TaxID=2685243 RepID=UPI00388B6473